MGPTFGVRHVVLLLQITRSKVESKSENSYIRHYLLQQQLYLQIQTRHSDNSKRRGQHFFSSIAYSLKFEFWAKIKTERREGELLQRYSIKSVGKEGS